jgi:hypothetical protein
VRTPTRIFDGATSIAEAAPPTRANECQADHEGSRALLRQEGLQCPTAFLNERSAPSIAEALHCYLERSPFAADALPTEVIAAVDSLVEDPLMWPADSEAGGGALLHRAALSLYDPLRGGSTEVIVLAVAGQRRRPGYWKDC